MQERLKDKIRLLHIEECANEIIKSIENENFDSFHNNSVLRIAVVKWIEIIGEASVNISGETKSKYPEVNWQAIKGMRNILVHEYFGIQYEIIWQTAKNDVPQIKSQVEHILKSFE